MVVYSVGEREERPERVWFRTTEAILERLQRLADERRWSVSLTVHLLIEGALEEWDDGGQAQEQT